jgi:hypothetical protein
MSHIGLLLVKQNESVTAAEGGDEVLPVQIAAAGYALARGSHLEA